jgi:HAD superfamily phosphatase (TIGR01668 family)
LTILFYKLFCPDLYVKSLQEIPWAGISQKNIKGLLFDLDNTLLPWGSCQIPGEISNWLQCAKEKGLQLCLVSNSYEKRVAGIARSLNIDYISWARKPANYGFAKAIRNMGLVPQEVAVIGDQIFTDIYGGNRLGCYTILVVPLSSHELPITKLVRMLERRLLVKLEQRGLLIKLNK